MICRCLGDGVWWRQVQSARRILTHRRSGQRLSSHQLGGAKTIQEVAELGVRGEPHAGEDETKGRRRRSQAFTKERRPVQLLWQAPSIENDGADRWSLLSLRAVAVHAAVGGLPAGLPSHPAPHLHRQARLCAPLDGAAQLLASCFCAHRHTQEKKEGEGEERGQINHGKWIFFFSQLRKISAENGRKKKHNTPK